MQILKKGLAACVIMLALCVGITANAAGDGSITPTAEQAAMLLSELGLFQQAGFDPDSNITRADTAVMIVRYLGQEEAALEAGADHPFTDVPDRVSPYVGWLYEQGLTIGMGNNCYSPDSWVTYEHFCLFLTRVTESGYNGVAENINVIYSPWHVFGEPGETHQETYNTRLPLPITQGDAAVVLAYALRAYDEREMITIGQMLRRRGLFTEPELAAAVDGVYGEGFKKNWLRIFYPIYKNGEPTEFYYAGKFLYYRDDKGIRHVLLKAPEDEATWAYDLVHYIEGYDVIGVQAGGKYLGYYVFDAGEIALLPIDLPADSYTMWLEAEQEIYAAGGNGLYKVSLPGGCEMVHPYGVPEESGQGICLGPNGVVSSLADNRILYVTDEGAEIEIFENLWVDKLRWGAQLRSYDGETLELIFPRLISQSMGGESTAYLYIIEAKGQSLVCTDVVYMVNSSVEELSLETKAEVIAYVQNEIDTGMFLRF